MRRDRELEEQRQKLQQKQAAVKALRGPVNEVLRQSPERGLLPGAAAERARSASPRGDQATSRLKPWSTSSPIDPTKAPLAREAPLRQATRCSGASCGKPQFSQAQVSSSGLNSRGEALVTVILPETVVQAELPGTTQLLDHRQGLMHYDGHDLEDQAAEQHRRILELKSELRNRDEGLRRIHFAAVGSAPPAMDESPVLLDSFRDSVSSASPGQTSPPWLACFGGANSEGPLLVTNVERAVRDRDARIHELEAWAAQNSEQRADLESAIRERDEQVQSLEEAHACQLADAEIRVARRCQVAHARQLQAREARIRELEAAASGAGQAAAAVVEELAAVELGLAHWDAQLARTGTTGLNNGEARAPLRAPPVVVHNQPVVSARSQWATGSSPWSGNTTPRRAVSPPPAAVMMPSRNFAHEECLKSLQVRLETDLERVMNGVQITATKLSVASKPRNEGMIATPRSHRNPVLDVDALARSKDMTAPTIVLPQPQLSQVLSTTVPAVRTASAPRWADMDGRDLDTPSSTRSLSPRRTGSAGCFAPGTRMPTPVLRSSSGLWLAGAGPCHGAAVPIRCRPQT